MNPSRGETGETRQIPAPTEGIWSAHYWRLTVGLILLVLGPAFEELAVPVALPSVVAQLGGLAFYGWTFSIFMLTSLVGIVIGGDLADRQGLATAYGVGILFFDLGLLIAGIAPSIYILLVGRAVQGFGGGILSSLGNAAVGRIYPEKLKPQMLAVLSTAFVLPGLVGPSLAGALVEFVGWRWVFLGLIPFCPLAMLLVSSSVKLGSSSPKGTGKQEKSDVPRVLMTAQLVIGTSLTLIGLEIHPLPLTLLLVILGLVIGGIATHRLLPPGTLTARIGLPSAIAVLGLLGLTYFGERAFLPLVLTDMRNQSSLVAGIAVTTATLTWTVGAWIQARLVNRYGRRILVLTGLACLILGIAGTICIIYSSVPVVIVVLAWAVAGTGMGIAYATSNLVVLEAAPVDREGYAASSMQLSTTLGIALGTGLEGAVVGISTLEPGTIIVTVVFLASACLAALAATRIPGKTS